MTTIAKSPVDPTTETVVINAPLIHRTNLVYCSPHRLGEIFLFNQMKKQVLIALSQHATIRINDLCSLWHSRLQPILQMYEYTETWNHKSLVLRPTMIDLIDATADTPLSVRSGSRSRSNSNASLCDWSVVSDQLSYVVL